MNGLRVPAAGAGREHAPGRLIALLGGPATSPSGSECTEPAGGDLDTLIWMFVLIVPYAILTTAGVLLWRRRRSAAAAMITLGFAATLLSVACSLFMTLKTHAVLVDLTSAPKAERDTFYIVAHHFPVLALGLLGIWAAALGTLWHVGQDRDHRVS